MKLIIEISEDDLTKVKDGRCPVSTMRKAILNGTPLPKGLFMSCEECGSEVYKMFNNPNSYEEVKSLISEDEYKKIYGGSDRLISEKAVLKAVSKGCCELRGVYARCEEGIKAIPSADIEQAYMKGREDGVNDFIKKSLIDE